ncbi:hypothetical protein, partial [Mesorhizobium sp.]|uniref:hypothetical protein n=1 Tax=Mesorhizobium sp. TaxID=1871066 RepID=UPI0025BB15C3
VDVQEARSTGKSAAAMLRLSLRPRRQPTDFKTNSPSASGRFVIAVPLQHRAAITLLFPTGNGTCVESASLGINLRRKVI